MFLYTYTILGPQTLFLILRGPAIVFLVVGGSLVFQGSRGCWFRFVLLQGFGGLSSFFRGLSVSVCVCGCRSS